MSDFKELLQQQLDVCRRFGSEFVTAPNEKKVGLAIKTMAKSPIFGVRLPVTHDTTGWYIHAGESSKDADFYPPLCTAHLVNYCPLVLKYLSLAPGFRFIIDENGYEDVWRE